jgi:hypothetical protein
VARADWLTRLNKSRWADHVIVWLALLPAFLMYYDRYAPEAAVYFTYFKNFFARPFSFQPDVVAFGAASPLHVLLHAPVYSLFGEHWILASKILNFLLVGLGMVALIRTIKGGLKSVLLTSLLVVLSTGMLCSVSQLFESGLAFLAMALLYQDLVEKNFERALVLCGLLYLIRAELVVVGLVVAFYIMIQSDKSKSLIPWLVAGCAPALAYHAYMLIATGTLVPSGVMAVLVTYIQEPASWWSRQAGTLSALWSAEGVIYLCGAVLLLVMLAEWSTPRYTKELLLLVPLVIVYILVPPGEAVIRYLVPVLPVLIALMVRYIEKELKVQHSNRALLVSLGLAHLFGAATLSASPRLDRQTVLLGDLSAALNKLAGPDDHVLLCDIQAQYEIAAPCHALAGNVGDEMVDVLLRRESVENFLQDQHVEFLVTSDALGRPLFENTLLSQLYARDHAQAPGDTVFLGGMALEKQFSHPSFMRRAALTQPAAAAPMSGPEPLWNSVYRVLGAESQVLASRAMAQLHVQPTAAPAATGLAETLPPGDSTTPEAASAGP